MYSIINIDQFYTLRLSKCV